MASLTGCHGNPESNKHTLGYQLPRKPPQFLTHSVNRYQCSYFLPFPFDAQGCSPELQDLVQGVVDELGHPGRAKVHPTAHHSRHKRAVRGNGEREEVTHGSRYGAGYTRERERAGKGQGEGERDEST